MVVCTQEEDDKIHIDLLGGDVTHAKSGHGILIGEPVTLSSNLLS